MFFPRLLPAKTYLGQRNYEDFIVDSRPILKELDNVYVLCKIRNHYLVRFSKDWYEQPELTGVYYYQGRRRIGFAGRNMVVAPVVEGEEPNPAYIGSARKIFYNILTHVTILFLTYVAMGILLALVLPAHTYSAVATEIIGVAIIIILEIIALPLWYKFVAPRLRELRDSKI